MKLMAVLGTGMTEKEVTPLEKLTARKTTPTRASSCAYGLLNELPYCRIRTWYSHSSLHSFFWNRPILALS